MPTIRKRSLRRKDPRERPIGVFDSGVGGLTVLHELLVTLPEENFVYLGDTARFPYGGRSAAELQEFSLEIADELLVHDAKLLVIACNSATAAALPVLQQRMMATTLGIDVVGVVRPEAVQAVAETRNGKIGLLATEATVASGAYSDALATIDPYVDLTAVPCPDLAPIIQHGDAINEHVVDVVRGYTRPLVDAGVDTVILGCTHYPLVRPLIQRMLGRNVTLVTSGGALARQVEHALSARGLETTRQTEGHYSFLTTGDAEEFRSLGSRFLQLPLSDVNHIDLTRKAPA
ncbi:MAG TPA: glutamate racemase [Baekduia sp.]|nr:glutamate racemase [Baekduia sp.]